MSEQISILDVIKRGGYEASLITTFNAHLPFYEEVVLRRLVAAGCRHNVVLMDRNQCGISWESEATRPRLAGYAYTLLPIGAAGAFHPKLCILVGPKKASILVGSHNLTLSGFGYNREVTNWVEIAGAKDAEGAAVLGEAWTQVAAWIELARGSAPDAMLNAALALANFVQPLIATPVPTVGNRLLAQVPGKTALLDQLADWAPENIKQIGVVGAFFDSELVLISELARRWPAANIVVGIDPDSVQLLRRPILDSVRFVDVREAWKDKPGAYLHAKLFYLSGTDTSLLVSGSANPSRPAWLGTAASGNVEAVLLRQGADAVRLAMDMGIAGLFDLPAIDDQTFNAIAARCKTMPAERKTLGWTFLLGTADQDTGEIRIRLPAGGLEVDAAEIFGPGLDSMGQTTVRQASDGHLLLQVGSQIQLARSCSLLKDGEPVAGVMIHHPDIIAATSQSTRQYQIRSALNALGSNEADISSVIASVEKVIFSNDTHRQIDLAVQERKEKLSGPVAASRPESLAVSIDDLPQERRRHRFLKSGNLAYLLDVLMRRLGEGLESEAVETDSAGRTEEEQVAQDDDDTPDRNSPEQTHTELSDPEIARAVARKARQLVRRMVKQLERAEQDEALQTSAVLQLIAVLALSRELRHLDKTPRWRKTGQSLVEQDDRRFLLDESVKCLLSSSVHLLKHMEEDAGGHSEEALQLRVLLLWLAWDVGDELTDPVSRMLDQDDLDARLQANALFLELVPPLISDAKAWEELERSMSRTIWPTPQAQSRAQRWIDRHWDYGKTWQQWRKMEAVLQVGSYACVPGILTEPRIVMEIVSGTIGVWDFDRIRRFMSGKVVSVKPMVTPAEGSPKETSLDLTST